MNEIILPGESLPIDAENWAARINGAWQNSVAAIIETGRLVAEAKAALPHGEFGPMVENHLHFSRQTANKLMRIAGDVRLSNDAHVRHLPPAWGTLYELTKLDDATFDARLADNTIRADMHRNDIATVVKKQARATKEELLGKQLMALPNKRYGVILSDDEWKQEVWSEKGMLKSAANHYPVSDIEALKVRDYASISADDCVYFMWATIPHLVQAIALMAHRGFEYKSHCMWRKIRVGDARGTGYWFAGEHEILMVGTRGKVPAPAPGTQWPSVIEAPVGEHSEKPEIFHELIEAYFPHLPKIELNARRARAGWDVWGYEAPEAIEESDTVKPLADGAACGADAPPLDESASPLQTPDANTLIRDAYAEDGPVDFAVLMAETGLKYAAIKKRASRMGLGDRDRQRKAVSIAAKKSNTRRAQV